MTAIEFYKFINDNEIEFHWADNNETNERDVIFFPYFWQIDEMYKIMQPVDFDDDGVKCVMKEKYYAIWASEILSGWDIDLIEIFGKDENRD